MGLSSAELIFQGKPHGQYLSTAAKNVKLQSAKHVSHSDQAHAPKYSTVKICVMDKSVWQHKAYLKYSVKVAAFLDAATLATMGSSSSTTTAVATSAADSPP